MLRLGFRRSNQNAPIVPPICAGWHVKGPYRNGSSGRHQPCHHSYSILRITFKELTISHIRGLHAPAMDALPAIV